MKCPYCAESISDDAIVCHSCQRDLNFFMPIFKQVSALEKRLQRLTERVEEPRQYSNEVVGLSEIAPLVAVLSSTVLAWLFTWLDWQSFVGNNIYVDTSIQALAVVSPFLGALGLGYMRRVKVSASLVLGATAGFLGCGQMLLLYALGKMDTALVSGSALSHPSAVFGFAVPAHWLWSMFYFPVSGAFLFLSGTMLAERIWADRKYEPSEANADSFSGLNKALLALSPVVSVVSTLVPVVKAILKLTSSS